MKFTLFTFILSLLLFSACEVTTKTSTTVTTPLGTTTKTTTETKNENGTNTVTEVKVEDNKQNEVPSSFTGSIKELMQKKQPLHCEAEINEAGASAKMHFYFDPQTEKYRYNITNISPQLSFNSYIITDNNYSYMWSDQDKQGTKIKEEGSNESDNGEMATEEDLEDKNMTYTCEKWNVDDSLFALPTDINFQEIDLSNTNETDFSAMDDSIPMPPID